MSDSKYAGKRILQRIADALGTDAATLCSEYEKPQPTHETLELLSAFERIVDPSERRICLDFVNAVAKRACEQPDVRRLDATGHIDGQSSPSAKPRRPI